MNETSPVNGRRFRWRWLVGVAVVIAGLGVWRWVSQENKPKMVVGRQARQAMIDAGIAATRQLAKHQLTWLRAMPERIVIDCLAADQPPRAYEILQRTLHL